MALTHPLDLDQSPGAGQGGDPALVYNSDTVSVRPVVEAAVQTSEAASLPSTITAVLTWNGTATTYTYSTAGDQPGDLLAVNAQAPSNATTTGRYPWKLEVIVPGQLDQTATGGAFVVARDSGPYGAGWAFGTTDQLVTIAYDSADNLPAGVLRVFGAGGSRFYQGTGPYTSPGDDPGTLAASGGGWTYTNPDGRVETFDANGNETEWRSADGQQTLQYRYDGGNHLTGMTAIDGGLTTFSQRTQQSSGFAGLIRGLR